MIWTVLGALLLAIAVLLGWGIFRPGTSWYGIDPDAAESLVAFPFVIAIIGAFLVIAGLT
jgi:hypothetical protein